MIDAKQFARYCFQVLEAREASWSPAGQHYTREFYDIIRELLPPLHAAWHWPLYIFVSEWYGENEEWIKEQLGVEYQPRHKEPKV